MPKYTSKYSKRTYDDHWKFSLLVIRQYLKLSFRELCAILLSFFEMERTPDHSTLVKFSANVDTGIICNMILVLAGPLCNDGMTVAVDATRFSCSNASKHYVRRLKDFGRSQIDHVMSLVRGFSKVTFAIDPQSLAILVCDVVDSHHADVKRMVHALKGLSKLDVDIGYVVADKGYDAEYVHVDVKEILNAEAIIPVRTIEPKRGSIPRTKGVNRSRMKRELTKGSEMRRTHNRRSLGEIVNSMIKRKMSDTVYGKIERTRTTEILFRSVAHNFRRLLDLDVDVSF